MNLGMLIQNLEGLDEDMVIQPSFKNPHSYRGSYDELCFEPSPDAETAGNLLELAKSVITPDSSGHIPVFEGWKGGDYSYARSTWVHFALQGETEPYDPEYGYQEVVQQWWDGVVKTTIPQAVQLKGLLAKATRLLMQESTAGHAEYCGGPWENCLACKDSYEFLHSPELIAAVGFDPEKDWQNNGG